MLKLLIVDDEPIVRIGIRDAIDWNAHGIRVTGECSNGQKAIQVAARERPDIVIADIRMPIMNGIDMAQTLKQLYPDIRIIMLTGFSETQDMIQALRIGVSDYLLKPMTAAEILTTVLRIRDEILRERSTENNAEIYENFYESNAILAVESNVLKVVRGQISAREAVQRLGKYHIRVCWDNSMFFAIPVHAGNSYDVFHAISSAMEGGRYTIALQNARTVLLLWIEGFELGKIRDNLDLLRRRLSAEAMDVSGIFYSSRAFSCDNANEQIQQAIVAVNRRYLYEQSDATVDFSREVYQDVPFEQLRPSYEMLFNAVLRNDLATQNTALAEIQRIIESRKPSREQFNGIVEFIVSTLLQSSARDRNVLIRAREGCADMALNQLFDLILEKSPAGNAASSAFMDDVTQYVNQNMSQKISTEDISAHMYMSVGHFCRRFKEQTGQTFMEWLHIARIEMAKKLLEQNDVKFYEIATRVGYGDYKTLSKYFRRYTHMSLSAYRRRLRLK